MDPNETLKSIAYELALTEPGHRHSARTRDRLRELCDALDEWLGKGGFAPNWDAYPAASAFYHHSAKLLRP